MVTEAQLAPLAYAPEREGLAPLEAAQRAHRSLSQGAQEIQTTRSYDMQRGTTVRQYTFSATGVLLFTHDHNQN